MSPPADRMGPPSSRSGREGAGDEVAERLLRLLAVVFIHVNHQRRDRPMPAERADLVQPEAGALPEFRRLGDARVP